MRFVPQQFFPSSDRPELLVDLQLPENASIYATKGVSARVDKLLTGDPDVDHWSTYVGQGAVRFYLPLNVQLPNDFFAQAVVVTKGLQQRERVKAKLERALAMDFPSIVGRVYPLELGPPVGWPLQYRVSGPESDQVRTIALRVAQLIGSAPGARNVNYNWMEPARTVRIQVDQDQARLLGLSSQDLAQSLNTVVSGVTATEMRSGIYLVDVLVRASAEERNSLAAIRSLQVPLPNGRTVPLSQIATVDYGQEYPIVWRRDRLPTVTVQADLAPGMQAATVAQALAPQVTALNAKLPDGYHVEVGGSVEESQKAQASVAAVLPLMLVLTLTVLMFQLQSFNRLFLVLSVAPLGLLGVVAALLLADKPLGFVALLGVLALTGMIARNSVILIDQIEKERSKGLHPWDAVIDATAHRFRPILLTAAAAILGMIPIAPTIFWGPMAYAIMGGLAVATLLTLVFLPALYVAWFRIKKPGPDDSQIINIESLPEESTSGTVGTATPMLPSPNWKQQRISKEKHYVAKDPVDCAHERDAWRCRNRAGRLARPVTSTSPWRSSWTARRGPSRSSRRWSCWSPFALAVLVLGPLAFLALLASGPVAPASMAVRVTLSTAPGPMPTATRILRPRQRLWLWPLSPWLRR